MKDLVFPHRLKSFFDIDQVQQAQYVLTQDK